jgi:uncharacterized protein (DUF4415 family)
MQKKKGTVRHTAGEIKAMRRRGEDRTDYRRIDAMTQVEIEGAAREEGEFDWTRAQTGFPLPKRQLTMRLDGDIIEWFKQQGRGYQTRMNAVLRRFVDAQKNSAR